MLRNSSNASSRPRMFSSCRLRVEPLEDRLTPSTFTVNTTLDEVTPGDGQLSLREAITRANTTPGADVIIVPAGIYTINLGGAGENANAFGDLDITDGVTIQGAGAGATIIDGQQLDRVFDIRRLVPESFQVVLQGLTARNGNVAGSGGGIAVANANLIVRDCTVTGNRALSGGGITNGAWSDTDIKIVRTTVARNVASVDGGGLDVGGSGSDLIVKNSTVQRNLAGASGGGISAGLATLTNSTVSGNVAVNQGGGIAAAIANLINCRVNGNTGGATGGGIYALNATLTDTTLSANASASEGGGLAAGVATLVNTTVSANTAGTQGGGVYSPTAVLTNCTLSGNSAGGSGGGIWATAATLLNVTVVENSAHTGGGIFHNVGGTFNVRNTIVALNLTDFTGTGPDISGAFASQGHNLIGNPSGGSGFTNGVNGDMVGTAANPIDPKLGALKNNGGKTQTHALKASSPAIDHGDNSLLPPTDQRGLPRKKDGNGDGLAIVDIGAFEK